MTRETLAEPEPDMDFAHARTMMVDNQIRTEDVTDWDVLRAFLTVPREDFLSNDRREMAYIGKDLPLTGGRRLMAPSSFARLLQLLLIGREDVVLTVGCGSGYAAAIMARLAHRVVALEENEELAAAASIALEAHGGANVSLVTGPLAEGYESAAPYDRIFFEGAVDEVPSAFVEQLCEGGRMVVVEGKGNAASARLYLKESNTVSNRFAFNCSIPPLPGFQRAPQFVF